MNTSNPVGKTLPYPTHLRRIGLSPTLEALCEKEWATWATAAFPYRMEPDVAFKRGFEAAYAVVNTAIINAIKQTEDVMTSPPSEPSS